MKIILAPAKKMIDASDDFPAESSPLYIEKTKKLYQWMKEKTCGEMQKVWQCSEKLAQQAYLYLENPPDTGLSPAVHSYVGLAYQHLSSSAMTYDELDWLREHLRILSGYYGILRPYDAIVPYRLEMQAPVKIGEAEDLYAFWGSSLYDALEDNVIVNLASAEYASAIEPYIKKEDRYITCIFAEMKNGKLITKGTYAKAARGDMVRWMAENRIEDPEEMRKFHLHFTYSEEASDAENYVFLRNIK